MVSMTNKNIDLVVPMYKARGTLVRLLSSVSSQSIKDYVHIILVQDADDENYDDILNIFKNILDIELITLTENSGPGTARRVGMKAGVCKYITCMDADDTFHNPFALQELYEKIEESQCDAVNSIFLEQLDGLSFIRHNYDWVWMFGKIYRRKFLEDNNIEMNDSRANEDTGFNIIVSTAGNTDYLDDSTYIWHFKHDSITRKDNGIYSFTGTEGWLYNMKWAIENLLRLKIKEEQIKGIVADNIMSTYRWFLQFCNESKTNKLIDIDKYKSWVNKYYVDIYSKHIPEDEQLQASYLSQLNIPDAFNAIPEYTFEQFLYMVGEGYGK